MEKKIGRRCIEILLAVLLVVNTVLGVQPLDAYAKEYSYFYYELMNDGTVKVTGYDKGRINDGILNIPGTIDGKKVTEIGDAAFTNDYKIKEANLPDTVETIGEKAFNGCTNLKEIELPDDLETIEEDAFFSCTRLSEVEFGNNVKDIESGAFYDCESLKSVVVPDSVTSMGEYVFGLCSKLESVKLSENITEIPNQTFFWCKSLKDIDVPDNAKTIGEFAFYLCEKLQNVSLPHNMKAIKTKAFYSCGMINKISTDAEVVEDLAFSNAGLGEIELKEGVKKLGKDVFYECSVNHQYYVNIPSSLVDMGSTEWPDGCMGYNVDSNNEVYTSVDGVVYSKDMKTLVKAPSGYINDYENIESVSVDIADGVKEIADSAFKGCMCVDRVTIPDSVEVIGDSAFWATSGISEINLPDSIKSIGDSAFCGMTGVESVVIPKDIQKISENCFAYARDLKEVVLPEGLKEIDDFAFAGSGLERIAIPGSVEDIKPTIFNSCDSLAEIQVSEANKNFCYEDNALYSKDKKRLVMYVGLADMSEDSNKEFRIPDGVEVVGGKAFINPNKLKSIYVPDSVSQIEDYALGYMGYYGSEYYDRTDTYLITDSNNNLINYAKNNALGAYRGIPAGNVTEVTLKDGQTFKFKVNNSFDGLVAFFSSDKNIATVDKNGVITPVASGTTKIIAAVGTNTYFCCDVTVNSKNKKKEKSFEDDYVKVSYADMGKWEEGYNTKNKDIPISLLDNSNTHFYTTNFYENIYAVLVGGVYMDKLKAQVGENYHQYYTSAKNLESELGRYTLHENTVLYRGTSNISHITGTDSSILAMADSIGKRYVNKNVASTSIQHDVTERFGYRDTHTVLEIYAPKGSKIGAYVKAISEYPTEYEYLLKNGLEYEVIDAGVREAEYEIDGTYSEEGTHKEKHIERYMKLKIISGYDKEEETTPEETTTEETTTEEMTTEETTTEETTTEETTKESVTTKPSEKTSDNGETITTEKTKKDNKNNTKKNAPGTGDDYKAGMIIIMGTIAVACFTVAARKRKTE